MKLNLKFPKDVYSDVRVEELDSAWYVVQNGDVENDSDKKEIGAMIRVFDGDMWYTASTNDLNTIQDELDSLAKLAKPNPDIYNHPFIKNLEVNKDSVFIYDKENDSRKVTRDDMKNLVDSYIEKCVDPSIKDVNVWGSSISVFHSVNTFYSSKGAEIEYDNQEINYAMFYGITVNDATYYAYKCYIKFDYKDLLNHEDEIIAERDRVIDFAHNCVPVEPGDYECVLSPFTTAMFTHESFGHKSESDFMLNDETLRAEWVMGKTVANELVSICDDGNLPNHGYTLYDDEGTKARPTWLIKNGKLTGRLHDAKSAATLNEELTGNSRAESYKHFPIVRMTNTYMEGGDTSFDEMISAIKDGIYVYSVNSGTGTAIFTMRPSICYRIRDGKICEPVKVNVITGSVFKTLFDIDAVGNDYELFDTYICGKGGQSAAVSAGGPSIRVKKLTFN